MTPAHIAAARRYLGVPFRHRGRRPDRLDCVGLVWRAYLDCGVSLEHRTDYGREPQHERFLREIEAAMGPAVAHGPISARALAGGAVQVGDMVTLRTLRHPHHVALVGDYPMGGLSLIHASGEHGRVVEHRLSPEYAARITHVFRRPV